MIRAAALALLLLGCSAQPTPFSTGDQVPAPAGCIDLRQRGGQC